ncbi:MAG: type II secretion system F family protein [Candidatus Ozemobacteraceae bacterium]
MKTFHITFQNPSGEDEIREVHAASADEADELIAAEGIIPLKTVEVAEAAEWSLTGLWGGVSLQELYHFTRLFGTLTRAGIPILEALSLIEERTKHQLLRKTLGRIRDDIQSGSGLGPAFSNHPRVFDPTYQNLIRVGEESGELGQVIGRLVTILDRRIKLGRAIRKAMTYPALVMVLSTIVTWGILTFIVPRFKDIYARFGNDLPWMTQFTLTASDILIHNTMSIVLLCVSAWLVFLLIRRTERGRDALDRLTLGIPLFGAMYHTYEIAQFSKSFSILIHSGLTVVSALDILIPAISRVPIREAVIKAAEEIRGGQSMGESFAAVEPWVPDLFNRMLTVGERSGNLTEMLDHVAEFYEEEFHNKVETIASLIEPLMIVFLGVIIGGIVISLYLPIFGMAKMITRR